MDEKKRMFSNRDLIRLIIPLMVEQTLVTLVGMADSVIGLRRTWSLDGNDV